MSDNSNWKHPAFIISLLLIVGVFLLIGAAVLDIDEGKVLKNMADSSFARGLITYLFAIVTIGTAIVIVVSVLTSDFDEKNQKKFENAKDVLSLLLGVFGVIVGFYFGSELGESSTMDSDRLSITSRLSEELVTRNQLLSITALVSGGSTPYQYGVSVGNDEELEIENFVDTNSRIVHEFNAPSVDMNTVLPITIEVEDANGRTVTTTTNLGISPLR